MNDHIWVIIWLWASKFGLLMAEILTTKNQIWVICGCVHIPISEIKDIISRMRDNKNWRRKIGESWWPNFDDDKKKVKVTDRKRQRVAGPVVLQNDLYEHNGLLPADY